LTDSDEWRKVWTSAEWPTSYEKNYPEEGLVESFARYFHDASTRAAMPREAREFWDRKVAEWDG
jgi:hypothetical protein